jgi:hypothetical protein
VSLTVNAVNDAPVAVNDSYSTNEDTVLTVAAPGVLGNDTDQDGDIANCGRRYGSGARHPDAECQRFVYLHTSRELQRPGQLHLSGQDASSR